VQWVQDHYSAKVECVPGATASEIGRLGCLIRYRKKIYRCLSIFGLSCAAVTFCRNQFVVSMAQDTGDAFLLLRVRRTAGITTIWRNGLVPWMLMVNKRLQSSHADLPSRIKCLGWPSAGDKRNTAKVAKDTSTSPLVVSNLRGTNDSGLGPQAIAPQVPEQVLVPATVPSQTTRQQYPVPLRPYTAVQ
jgi:hypothetical protein